MDVRASDAERNTTIERLRDAAAEGRLTLEELADRIEAASGAVMRSELEDLVSDLPAATPAVIADSGEVRAVGDVKRTGAWVVPADSRYTSWFGNIKLDLRQATITGFEVRIHAWTVFGDVDLLVPEGVQVDVHANSRLGQLKQKADAAPVPGAPRIVLTGGTVLGDVKIRHKRLWEKLVRR
jgi:hypothetical protein